MATRTLTVCDCCGLDMSEGKRLPDAIPLYDSQGGSVGSVRYTIEASVSRRALDVCASCIAEAFSIGAPRHQRAPRAGSQKEKFRSLVHKLIEASAAGVVHRSAVIAAVEDARLFPPPADLDRTVSKYLTCDATLKPAGCGEWGLVNKAEGSS